MIGYKKGVQSAGRQALLEMHAASLESSSSIVDDEAARAALKEAAGILRDIVERGPDGVGRRVQRQTVSAGG